MFDRDVALMLYEMCVDSPEAQVEQVLRPNPNSHPEFSFVSVVSR